MSKSAGKLTIHKYDGKWFLCEVGESSHEALFYTTDHETMLDVFRNNDRMGPAASCHLCVGAGGYEDHEGQWVDCSCQRADRQNDG